MQEEFIHLLKTGDEQAFVQLMDEFQDRVFNIVISFLQNRQDAEDVTQEVFIQIFRSIHEFRGDAKLSTWIYRVALSKATEWERRKKAKKRFAQMKSILGFGDWEPEIPDFHHPGVQLDKKEQAALLFKAIKRLPENQRLAFLLIKAEGLSYQEVGEILNKNTKSLEGLMHRAKENLRIYLKDINN